MATARSNPPDNVYPTTRERFLAGALCAMTACSALSTRLPDYDGERDRPVEAHLLAAAIDPNNDPWWKLTALPNIGRIKAGRIVHYRQQSSDPRPFRTAADLSGIPGIGPTTIRQIAPLLRLDPPLNPAGASP